MTVKRTPFEVTLGRRAFLGGLTGAVAVAAPGRAARAVTVLAAASLKPALDPIAASFPEPVALSYGGSGTLARQAAMGAPADVIVLAAVDWMDWLAGQGVLGEAPVHVAENRLVLASPLGESPLELTPEAIDARLGGTGRFAMGDPLSVPAGRYGQQALETLGLWASLRSRAILAENVRAALAYVARGDVSLGLVYGSDVRGSGVAEVAAIPNGSHQPIVYPAAVLRGARPEAAGFLRHIARATDTFRQHGFHR